jgi:hypothetical protein
MQGFPLSWEQMGTVLFFGGFSWWAIKWAGRNLRAQIGESGVGRVRRELSQDAIDAILARGLATPEQLFAMSADEQRLLGQTALALVTATQRVPDGETITVAPRTHCPACGRLVENFPTEVPWRSTCDGCGCALLLRRDGQRLVLSYTPKSA